MQTFRTQALIRKLSHLNRLADRAARQGRDIGRLEVRRIPGVMDRVEDALRA